MEKGTVPWPEIRETLYHPVAFKGRKESDYWKCQESSRKGFWPGAEGFHRKTRPVSTLLCAEWD